MPSSSGSTSTASEKTCAGIPGPRASRMTSTAPISATSPALPPSSSTGAAIAARTTSTPSPPRSGRRGRAPRWPRSEKLSRSAASLVEHLLHDALGRVDADLAQPTVARVDEAMRGAGGDHDDLSGAGLDRLTVDGERHPALLDDERLPVGRA